MNSLLSSILRNDNSLDNSIIQLMTQYNRNQQLYNQNTEIMLTMIDSLIQRRYSNANTNANTNTNANANARTGERDDYEEQVYEFALPTNISDILLRALIPMDMSGQLLSNTNAPTANEIARGTTAYNYVETDTPLVCPISLETIEDNDIVMKINRCGHVFKEQHLRRWFQRNRLCPVCRGGL